MSQDSPAARHEGLLPLLMEGIRVTALAWLVIAVAMAGQVGVLIVAWRLVVWLVSGRNPWREPPRWPWRRDAVRAARSDGTGSIHHGHEPT